MKSKWDSTSLTSTIEVLREEVELSNTRTAYVMHIANTLSLISARKNRKRKFQWRLSSVNFILKLFNNVTSDGLFHGGYHVVRSKRCAVQNQWKALTTFSTNY